MPYTAEHKSRTRERIVAAAADLLRTEGLAGTGVARVMTKAGLTHGGFYAHFSSKDELISAAFEAAVLDAGRNLSEGLEDLDAPERLRHYLGRYLSRTHRDNPGEGCPLSALGAELSRAGPSAQAGFERGMRRLMTGFAKVLPPQTGSELLTSGNGDDGDEQLLGVMAMMIGGLMLSRAVADEDFSNHILRTTRRAALKAAEGGIATGATT